MAYTSQAEMGEGLQILKISQKSELGDKRSW